MSSPRVLACTICGECEPGNQRWFLLTEDRWQDKLRILHWDDYLAAQEGMHCACSAAHLQQLVIHWTTTGSLDHPFAKSHSGLEMVRRPRRVGWTAREDAGISGPKPIGELSVHRESMQRVLRENTILANHSGCAFKRSPERNSPSRTQNRLGKRGCPERPSRSLTRTVSPESVVIPQPPIPSTPHPPYLAISFGAPKASLNLLK